MKWRLARAAYEGYRKHTGGKSLATGQPIPEWYDLPDPIKDAWKASITAIQQEIADEVKNRIDDVRYTFCERLMAE